MKIETWLDHEIRFIEIDGEWWAVAKDIADALRYSETTAMTKHMRKKYLMSARLAGMNMKSTLISEHGIYKALMRSQRPEAEQFEDWVLDVLVKLRQQSGLEGFQVSRMLDKEHQKQAMDKISQMNKPQPKHYMKANTIANKAVANKYGLPRAIKKENMTVEMLQDRQPIIEDTAHLMLMKDRFDLDMSISKAIYKKYN
jgi:prophage antirepressor-like protein